MKTLYLECNMGAAGDMLMAALLEVAGDEEGFVKKMNSLGLPGVELSIEKAVKCGITGTHAKVQVNGEEEGSLDVSEGDEMHEHPHFHGAFEHSHEHHHHDHDHEHDHHHDHEHDHEHDHQHHHAHHSLADIAAIIDGLDVPEKVREDAKAVYMMIADAESQVHGRQIDQVHFHEVGNMDAVTDVVGVCLLMDRIGADKVIVSPVHVGSGNVRCAHGILPVPAPATALILKGVPVYGGDVRGELCTPTGAALLRHFATDFGSMPAMAIEKTGYGMGSKDFERANCVRAFLGESADPKPAAGTLLADYAEFAVEGDPDEIFITKLECNLDDMTGEDLGFAIDQLFAVGARDAFTHPVYMKKSRPGIMLSVICLTRDADRIAAEMLKHTTTLGVRRQDMKRYILARSVQTVQTELGPVRIKDSGGFGVARSKAEYDDVAKIAAEKGISIAEARAEIDRALQEL